MLKFFSKRVTILELVTRFVTPKMRNTVLQLVFVTQEL